MSEFKGTPGPWKYNANTRQIGVVDTSDTQSYGMMLSVAYIDECDHSEYASNARLIAAAPDLLEALQNLMTRVQYDKDAKHWFTDEQKAARAAIAKALGEKDE